MGLISEQIRQDIQPYIKKVFKFLDEEKKNVKTRKALLEKIKDLMPYVGIPEGHEIFILELYSLNHRKDGDYSDLNKDNYIDPRERKGKVISNTKADLYTTALLPFRGSNLEGYWRKDYKGVDEYIVISYGWYPILVFKNDNWYKVTSNYSASTGRQVSNSTPKFGQNSAYLLTPTEMNDLVRGKSHEEILKDKRKSLKKTEPELTKRARTISPSSWDRYGGEPISKYKIKFKINRIDLDGDKAKVFIDIIDVMKRDPVSLKQIKTPENYTKGELPEVTIQEVEKRVKRELANKFREYFGKNPYFWNANDEQQIRDSENIDLIFNHLRK
jgi:hypothetical protein